jgi:peptidoglycan-N-acetylglucosamine deacetylase
LRQLKVLSVLLLLPAAGFLLAAEKSSRAPMAPATTPGGYGRELQISKSKASTTRDDGGPKAVFDWPTGRKLVALTFDDGPNPRYTPGLMQLLEKRRTKATFFVLGEMLRSSPSISAAQVSPLFEIGNHSYDHKQLTKLGDDAIIRELSRTEDLITSVTGRRSVLVRPPYGAADSRVRRLCAQEGYRVIQWDIDTNDWRGRTVQQMSENILKNVRDGSIILMHDHFKTSHETTGIIIDELRARGFEFVTVSEMLSFPRRESAPAPQATSKPGKAQKPAEGGAR